MKNIFNYRKVTVAEVQVGIICIHNSVRQRNNRDTIDINLKKSKGTSQVLAVMVHLSVHLLNNLSLASLS